MDISNEYRSSSGLASLWLSPPSVILLTIFLLLSSCSGGSGESGPKGAPGASGQICISGSDSYSIELDGSEPQSITFEDDPLLTLYQGNIGGQIRAVEPMNIALPGEESMNLLTWGSGASIKYGNDEVIVGTAILRHPGVVTSLASVRSNDQPKLLYSTERGVGVVGISDEGELNDIGSAYRRVASGALSIAATEDGSRVVYTTGDGYLEETTLSDLEGGEACSSILSSARVLEGGEENYLPVKVNLVNDKAFVLARLKSIIPSTAPTFEEVYDGIFAGMVVDIQTALVRGVDLDDHEIHEVGFDALDDSFRFYDSFVPTDISTDGMNLYIVGIAYKRSSMESFIVANCEESGQRAQIKCVREAARDGTLTSYMEEGIFSFNAGFFVYKNMSELAKADHFTTLPIAAFKHVEEAPPFFYRMVIDGDIGFIRGPNFMLSMSKGSTVSGGDEWTFVSEIDSRAAELKSGIPSDIVSYAGGAAASFTAVRSQDGTGASAVELMGSDGAFSVIDTGSIYVRIEGAGSNSVAAIEMASYRGGNLYIENATERILIEDLYSSNAFVAQAAYNGDMLAFVWSTKGGSTSTEAQQGWRLQVQRGTDGETRGTEEFIARTGGGDEKYFDGFPSIEDGDMPGLVKGMGDLEFAEGEKIVMLLTGFKGGVWYHQAALFNYEKVEDKYRATLSALSKTQKKSGSSTEHSGRILKATKVSGKYEIVFSTSDGIYKWTVAAGTSGATKEGSVKKLFSVENFIDAAVDGLGKKKVAIISGRNLSIKDLSNTSASGTSVGIAREEGSTLTKLIGARVSLHGSMLSVVTPYGAAHPFSIYSVSGNSAPTIAATCDSCHFLDVNVFKSFPNHLLTSSMTSGIEIYSTD